MIYILDATETDSDALFLFETLDRQKFVNIDTRIGFDFEETLAIIKVLHISTVNIYFVHLE